MTAPALILYRRNGLFMKIEKFNITGEKKRGFSLVELILAVGIASVFMVGIGMFFSSSIKNAFEAQSRVSATQQQFTANAILQEKFSEITKILNEDEFTGSPMTANRLIAMAKPEADLPFTYIGQNNAGKLTLKNWLPFNKIIQDSNGNNLYGNSEAGEIKNANDEAMALSNLPLNFAGFTIKDNNFLIALPETNKIITCAPGVCSTPYIPLTVNDLNSPTDIATDGTKLFIADSGNNRVLQVEASGVSELATDLNFPTGLAYDEVNNALFVADTLNNQIKRITWNESGEPNEPTIVAGFGDDEDCDGTALYCKLNFPTGLFFGDIPGTAPSQKALYISDSGNNRIVRITDSGKPESVSLSVDTNGVTEQFAKITIQFPQEINLAAATLSNIFNIPGAGLFARSQNTLEYQLFTTLTENTATTNICTTDPCSANSSLLVADDLLSGGVPLLLQQEEVSVDTADPQGDNFLISLNESLANDYLTGEKVILKFTMPGSFSMAVNGIDSTNFSGNALITINGYKADNSVLFTRYQNLPIGDGKIGTLEDQAKVLTLTPSPIFPTGVSNTFIASTGGKQIVQISGGAADLNPYDIAEFSNFRYTSDFILNDQGVIFTKIQSDELLQMSFQTLSADGDSQNFSLTTRWPSP